MRTLVLVSLVTGGGRPVQDVIQVKTVRFGATSFLFVESLQVIHGCTGTPGENKIQKQKLTENAVGHLHYCLSVCLHCCTHSRFSWVMSKEAAMLISVGRQCRWWLCEWGRIVLAWKREESRWRCIVGEQIILGWKIKAKRKIKRQSKCVCRQSVTFTLVKLKKCKKITYIFTN